MKEMMILLGRKTLFLLRWVLRLCWKIVKWPVYVVVFIIALYQLMLLPFRFMDGVYVFGDERAIHKKNFNYVIKEAAKKDQFIRDTIQDVPEEEYLERLMKAYPDCCHVELAQLAFENGVHGNYDIIENKRNVKIFYEAHMAETRMNIFINSYFGIQDYIYDVYAPGEIGKQSGYRLFCIAKGGCWQD